MRGASRVINISMSYRDNEKAMAQQMMDDAVEMLQAAKLENVQGFNRPVTPGSVIHEMGTARMGRDPKTSVLNAHNQVHAVPNVFVTDGSCMVSSPTQNPSLTYMALTARAADHAVDAAQARRDLNSARRLRRVRIARVHSGHYRPSEATALAASRNAPTP